MKDENFTDYNFNSGKEKLKEKRLFSKIIKKLKKLESINEGGGYNKEFASEGWEEHYTINRLLEQNSLNKELDEFSWHFDSYNKKHNVAMEFEKGPQTQARWDWVKFQLGKVDVGVQVIDYMADASVERCKKELESNIFKKIINTNVPMYLIEWPIKR